MGHQLEAMFQDPDDLAFCETCGKPRCDVVKLGCRWCKECWQAFQSEYNTWLDSTSKEISNGK